MERLKKRTVAIKTLGYKKSKAVLLIIGTVGGCYGNRIILRWRHNEFILNISEVYLKSGQCQAVGHTTNNKL